MSSYTQQFSSHKNVMLNSLTSFRFLAALMVCIFHVGIWPNYQTGYLGVSFFFILSGFILAYTYSTKLNKIDVFKIKKFYIARFAKIYPLHILTFIFAVPYYFLIPLKHEPILYFFQAFTNIFLIHSFIPFGNVSFNGVSWSLSDEAFFYIMFPFLIFFILKFVRSTPKKIFMISILWSILIVCFSLIPSNNNLSTWLAYFFPGSRIFEFFVGINLGLIFLKTRELLLRFSDFVYSLLEISSIFLLVFMIIISPNFAQNLRYNLIFIPCWGLIIFIFAFQKGVISNILSNKILIYLGEISFSFYMIHNLVLSYIYFLWKPKIDPTLTIVLCFIISLIMSSLLYHFYEEPMRKKVRRYFDKKLEKNKLVITRDKVMEL